MASTGVLNFKEKYSQALVGGRARCSHGRIMFLGASGVGKTSLIRGLMNQRLSDKIESTILAETLTVKCSSADLQWTAVTENDKIAEEVQAVMNCTMLDSLPKPSVNESSMHSQHKKKVILHASKGVSTTDQPVFLHIWDCSGNPVFLDALPVFMSPRTMFLLVFNAFECINVEQQCITATTLSLLHKWMALIHAHDGVGMLSNKYSFPRVLLVGTHGDQIAPGKPHVEQKRLASQVLDKLFASLKGKEYADILLDAIVVDNTTAGMDPQADPGFREIQEIVYSFVHDKLTIQVPVSWIHFHNILQLLETRRPVIQLNEVQSIAAECYVLPEQMTRALQFYYECGDCMVYPDIDGLGSVVFLESQWFLDQFSKIFVRQADDKDLWDTPTNQGILVESHYKALLGHVHEHNFTPAALIRLLEHFLLATPIRKGHETTDYFAPVMIQNYHSSSSGLSTEVYFSSLSRAAPIHLIFTSGYVPPGYFVRLATSLASKQGVMVFYPRTYHDQITMNIGVDKLIITEHTETIELQCTRQITDNQPFEESCRMLLKLLTEECLSEVHHCLGTRPQLAFSCQICACENIFSQTPKFCLITFQLSVDQHLYCQMGHISLATDDQQYWLHRDSEKDAWGLYHDSEKGAVEDPKESTSTGGSFNLDEISPAVHGKSGDDQNDDAKDFIGEPEAPSLEKDKENFDRSQKKLEMEYKELETSNEKLMTTKMCRSVDDLISKLLQDYQLLQEKYLLQKQLQATVFTCNKAVQANYLPVALNYLRGADVYGETVLEVVGDQPQKLEWPGYGFYIEVPEGALPPGVTASVAVKVILGGHFQFPEGSQLISALYWISSSEVFLKEVAVNIQHCAIIKNEEQCSTFRFIIAKCSQEVLPYRFKERVGVFNPHTQYGTIRLKQFSIVGETAPDDSETQCIGFLFYKELAANPDLIAEFHFVVVKDLTPFFQVVNYEYQGWRKDRHTLEVCFNDTAMQLNQEEQRVDPWNIVPLDSPSRITKAAVTNFQPGKRIPHCAFELQLLSGMTLKRLCHKVELTGTSSPNSFRMRYPQPEEYKVHPVPRSSEVAYSPGLPHSSTADPNSSIPSSPMPKPVLSDPPELTDLLNKVGVKIKQKWKEVGLQLKISNSDITVIAMNGQIPILCFSEVLDKWRTKGSPPYTWSTVIDALRAPIVDEIALANEVDKLYITA